MPRSLAITDGQAADDCALKQFERNRKAEQKDIAGKEGGAGAGAIAKDETGAKAGQKQQQQGAKRKREEGEDRASEQAGKRRKRSKRWRKSGGR